MLCDPWFSSAYEGAWVQWPKIENPLEVCGPADYLYISHVHPDHYDPQFLKAYLARYPACRVLIAKQQPELLWRKLMARGIVPIVGDVKAGGTYLATFPNHLGTGTDIDSALLVRHDDQAVVNLNDNPYDEQQVANISTCLVGCKTTVACLPFVGAGPWPQAYHFDTAAERFIAEARKKQLYLDLFKRYCEALRPTVAVPFAGQYWLHGDKLDLNPRRGMADATECKALYERVWVPSDGGHSTLNIERGDRIMEPGDTWWTSERKEPYDWPMVREALCRYDHPIFGSAATVHLPYRYECEIQVPIERLPLLKLLQSAVLKPFPSFRDKKTLHIYFQTSLPGWLHVITDSGNVEQCEQAVLHPRVEIKMDARYLFGCLTRLYNWNSARIGSLATFRHVPKEFNQELYDLMGDFLDSLRV